MMKLRADKFRGMLATVHFTMFCLPVSSLKMHRLKTPETTCFGVVGGGGGAYENIWV
jgi:hypothetical protein